MTSSINVSVIIPTYNRRDYVQETIDSILAQTYTDYEIIVIDDGSTDGTQEVLSAKYGSSLRYIYQENKGESAARNLGIELAQGEFIALLDSDDIWLPEKLEIQLAKIAAHPDWGMVFSQAWPIDGTGARLEIDAPLGAAREPKDYDLPNLCMQNTITSPSTVLIRRSVLARAGVFDQSIRYGEDWDLWIRIAAESVIGYIPMPLALVRMHRKAQSHHIDLDANTQRLNDHLSFLSKAYDRYKQKIPAFMYHRSTAYQYLQAFVTGIAAGDRDAALKHLQLAYELDPKFVRDSDDLGKLIGNRIAYLEQLSTHDASCASQEYLDTLFNVLREVYPVGNSFEKQIRAKTNVTLGFIVAKKEGAFAARPYFIKAIREDAGWLRNVGVLSLLIESYLGKERWLRVKGFLQIISGTRRRKT